MWPHPRASILVHYDVRPVEVPIELRAASTSHAFVVVRRGGLLSSLCMPLRHAQSLP